MIVGPLLFLFFIIFLFFFCIGSIFWVWMIVDCAVHEPANDSNKIVWMMIVIFTHIIGASIYFLVRRQQRIREVGR